MVKLQKEMSQAFLVLFDDLLFVLLKREQNDWSKNYRAYAWRHWRKDPIEASIKERNDFVNLQFIVPAISLLLSNVVEIRPQNY